VLAHVHHVAGVVVVPLDAAVGREARTAQRVFGAEEGRGEVVVALAHPDAQAAVLAQGAADVGGHVQVGGAAARAAGDVPLPVAGAADRGIDHVRRVLQPLARPGVHGGGVGAVDAVEAGVVVRAVAGVVVI